MLNLLPSIVVLGLAAVAAMHQVSKRWTPPEKDTERLSAGRALAVATVVQGAHFAEEAATGFHERLGPLFGLPQIPLSVFVIFNVVWLGIWAASIFGLRSARPAAFFAAWFLAIAGMINGIAHPLLGMAAGGYFPGLVSSTVIAVACVWLWHRLQAATAPRPHASVP